MSDFIRIKNKNTGLFYFTYNTFSETFIYNKKGKMFSSQSHIVKYFSDINIELNFNEHVLVKTKCIEEIDNNTSLLQDDIQHISNILNDFNKKVKLRTKKNNYDSINDHMILYNLKTLLCNLWDKNKLSLVKYIVCFEIPGNTGILINDQKNFPKHLRKELRSLGIKYNEYNISGNCVSFFNDDHMMMVKLKFNIRYEMIFK